MSLIRNCMNTVYPGYYAAPQAFEPYFLPRRLKLNRRKEKRETAKENKKWDQVWKANTKTDIINSELARRQAKVDASTLVLTGSVTTSWLAGVWHKLDAHKKVSAVLAAATTTALAVIGVHKGKLGQDLGRGFLEKAADQKAEALLWKNREIYGYSKLKNKGLIAGDA